MKKLTIVFKKNTETKIPRKIYNSVPLGGAADSAIDELFEHCNFQADPDEVKGYLQYLGIDPDEINERSDLDNLKILVWDACLNCQEQKTVWFYMGE